MIGRDGAGCGRGSTATMAGDSVGIEATSEKLSLSGGGGADGGVSVSVSGGDGAGAVQISSGAGGSTIIASADGTTASGGE